MVVFTLFRTQLLLFKQNMRFKYKGMSFGDIKNALELSPFTLNL